MSKVKVLDHGHIELYGWLGNDLKIVNSARQSFGQESHRMGEKEYGLINYLMKNRHGTPFESVVFTFDVKCPIFVAREWFRHRIASYNELSGRYSKLPNEFYLPSQEMIRTQVGKMGNYKFEPVSPRRAKIYQKMMTAAYTMSWYTYELLLKFGVAKEVARMVLPVSVYTQFTWTVNLRSLFNFINLRSGEHAMSEIRIYSQQIEQLIELIVPVTYEAFLENGRIAP